jgi:SulP family sulfate permease
LKDYSWNKFSADALAGVTVGLVALPLAMAFAIASGVAPQAGLYCAIVAGFLISALGGSTTQIGGPTGAFVVVIYGIVAKYGLDGLFMCTLMAGVFVVILGATGLGSADKYIPLPVVRDSRTGSRYSSLKPGGIPHCVRFTENVLRERNDGKKLPIRAL